MLLTSLKISMSQALYRKYRSKKLSEIVGQEHITRTLENALKTGRISHAYLFTGPRGVGKTSIARILAHEINRLPYTDESMHLDIIEIDAASNRRIDEIRDLREKVHIAPTSAKYKVYIIDEVHMLTKEAFNALLKTLEEPPAHVVFILATTEIHKLPGTIISRTQRFTFKPIDTAEAVRHLAAIAKSEGMQIDEDALELLAVHGGGSFRDSISLLDQVGHSKKKVSRSDAEKLVGIAASQHIGALLEAVYAGSPAEILCLQDKLIEDGISPGQTAKQLSALIRREIVEGRAQPGHTGLLTDLLKVQASPEPAAQLEIALLKQGLSDKRVSGSMGTNQAPAGKNNPAVITGSKQVIPKQPLNDSSAPKPSTLNSEVPLDWWNDVLKQIKTINNTLYGVLRMAEPRLDGETLHLGFGFGLHKNIVVEAPTQAKILEAVKAVTGKSYLINAVHDKTLGKAPKVTAAIEDIRHPATETNDELSSITNIFGGGEVLES